MLKSVDCQGQNICYLILDVAVAERTMHAQTAGADRQRWMAARRDRWRAGHLSSRLQSSRSTVDGTLRAETLTYAASLHAGLPRIRPADALTGTAKLAQS